MGEPLHLMGLNSCFRTLLKKKRKKKSESLSNIVCLLFLFSLHLFVSACKWFVNLEFAEKFRFSFNQLFFLEQCLQKSKMNFEIHFVRIHLELCLFVRRSSKKSWELFFKMEDVFVFDFFFQFLWSVRGFSVCLLSQNFFQLSVNCF